MGGSQCQQLIVVTLAALMRVPVVRTDDGMNCRLIECRPNWRPTVYSQESITFTVLCHTIHDLHSSTVVFIAILQNKEIDTCKELEYVINLQYRGLG